MTERTEAAAATNVTNELERLLADALNDMYRENYDPDAGYVARIAAEAVAAHYTVTYQRRGGLRRAVLYGAWEVDPAAVVAPGPARPAPDVVNAAA